MLHMHFTSEPSQKFWQALTLMSDFQISLDFDSDPTPATDTNYNHAAYSFGGASAHNRENSTGSIFQFLPGGTGFATPTINTPTPSSNSKPLAGLKNPFSSDKDQSSSQLNQKSQSALRHVGSSGHLKGGSGSELHQQRNASNASITTIDEGFEEDMRFDASNNASKSIGKELMVVFERFITRAEIKMSESLGVPIVRGL
jgi:hypothetical protein